MRRVHCSFIRLGANLGKTLSVFKAKHDAIDYPGALFVQSSSRQPMQVSRLSTSP